MFEVVYICTSCKHAAEFMDSLMWDLREHEICDFEIDRKNLRIKADEFIVSAVNIFGQNAGRSYRNAKYFINSAEPTTPDMWKMEEKINLAAESIKMRIPPWANEISEERLIDVLKEVRNETIS